MRIRIIIDTDDARDPGVVYADTPFTLNVFADDNDGTHSWESLEIGSEFAIIGDDIPQMLGELGREWDTARVVDQDGSPLPRNGAEWRMRRGEED